MKNFKILTVDFNYILHVGISAPNASLGFDQKLEEYLETVFDTLFPFSWNMLPPPGEYIYSEGY